MTAFDLIVIGIVAVSTLLAFWRGFVRVVVSLLSWVIALIAAIEFSDAVGALLPEFGAAPAVRYVAAFALILIAVLLAGALLGWTLAKLVRAIGLGFLDRLLGALLGAARGVLIAVLAVLLAGMTGLPRQDWWQNAMFAPPLVAAAVSLEPWLPPAWAERLHYGPGEPRSIKPTLTRVKSLDSRAPRLKLQRDCCLLFWLLHDLAPNDSLPDLGQS